jgi:periplasmic copper chaperone A
MPSSPPSSADRRVAALALAAVVALAAISCSSTPRVDLHIDDPWARASIGTDSPTAAYMTISNRGNLDDTLWAATFEGAERVEFHRTTTDSTGMHQMEPIASIHVPAGGTVTLEPGGIHLMIFGLSQPLEPGEPALIVLSFEQAGDVMVEADVRAP